MVFAMTPFQVRRPGQLDERVGAHTPSKLLAIGNEALLSDHKVAFFCSSRCPGDAILGAYDSARKLRDDGVTVISGFHSPVEKECLRILLRGKQPIIICPARALEKFRLPADWRKALDAGRLLILSPFEKYPRRPTTESARQRNELVAALSDDALIIYATPGGSLERLAELVDRWGIPRRKNKDAKPLNPA